MPKSPAQRMREYRARKRSKSVTSVTPVFDAAAFLESIGASDWDDDMCRHVLSMLLVDIALSTGSLPVLAVESMRSLVRGKP